MEKIKEIYQCHPLEETDALSRWHNEVLEKTAGELTELDVARCLRQELFVESAAEAMMSHLLQNPLAGGQYEGELMELAGDVDEHVMARFANEIRGIIIAAENLLYVKEWDSPEDRDAFFRSGVNMRRFIDADHLLDLLEQTEDQKARNQIARCLGSMHCDDAVEPLMNLITDPELGCSKGPMLYALQNLNITFRQLVELLPFISKGNLEERVSASELLKLNLCRLDEEEMSKVSSLLQEMIDEA